MNRFFDKCMLRDFYTRKHFGGRFDDTFAIIGSPHSRNSLPLCKRHLDTWLDKADDDPTTEPTYIQFVNPWAQ